MDGAVRLAWTGPIGSLKASDRDGDRSRLGRSIVQATRLMAATTRLVAELTIPQRNPVRCRSHPFLRQHWSRGPTRLGRHPASSVRPKTVIDGPGSTHTVFVHPGRLGVAVHSSDPRARRLAWQGRPTGTMTSPRSNDPARRSVLSAYEHRRHEVTNTFDAALTAVTGIFDAAEGRFRERRPAGVDLTITSGLIAPVSSAVSRRPRQHIERAGSTVAHVFAPAPKIVKRCDSDGLMAHQSMSKVTSESSPLRILLPPGL